MPKKYNKSTGKWEEAGSSDKTVTGKGKLFGFKNQRKVNQDMSKVRKKTGKTEADLKNISESELKRASTSKMKPSGSSNKNYYGAPTDKSKSSNADAGSNIRTSSGTNYNVGESKGGVSFNKAFKHFKDKGAKEFTWNGKRYTTKSA